MKVIKHLIPLAVLLSLAACNDDPSGPGDGNGLGSGSLSFDHRIDGVTGKFQASGKAPSNGSLGNWAGGGRLTDDGDTEILVTGVTRTGNDYDMVTIDLQGGHTGTYDLGSNCEINCAYAALAFGVTSWTDSGDLGCTLSDGQVIVTAISSTEAKGTFSGEGVCVGDNMQEKEITVTGGTFDVKLVALDND